MNLEYKTRGDTSPQGKPRVFFSCHPADFGTYFEELSTEIIKIIDCAIYYYGSEEEVPIDEDYYLNLSQMQLFVMPVTTRLLTQSSRALSVEFAYAIENHIPILPISMETGLDSVFRKKCGDMQFLNRAKRDDTAIPYEEKLKTFLTSVLVGDDLAGKVRAAFDAYIFLSYRKKDRKYAQELMRMIHKNEFCRDIAIWYDEFLTPGEGFNEAIAEAMQKSRLFALAVTPNLVNETNYVMEKEYPMARDAGKPILPAELVETDKAALKANYADIPDCTDAHDEKALSAAMLSMLQDLAIRVNDDDPQHNFFIGLAYLSGIDVEVDHTRAVALITSAAEAGLLEAAKHLAQMYLTGKGVGYDYEEAIVWQKKATEILEQRYDKSKVIEDYCDWLSELVNLGDFYRDAGQLTDSEMVYNKLLGAGAVIEDIALANVYLAWGYDKLGAVYKERGDNRKAEESYCKALEIKIKSNEQDEEEMLLSVGDILLSYIDLSELTDSETYINNALELGKRIAQKFPGEDMRKLFSHLYNSAGNVLRSQKDISKSIVYYRRATEIYEQLMLETEGAREKNNCIAAYINLADALERIKEFEESLHYYMIALSLAERLVAETNSIEAKLSLSIVYGSIAGAERFTDGLSYQQANEKKRSYCEKRIEVLEGLSETVETVYVYSQLVTAYQDIALIYRLIGEEDNAEMYLRKALLICDRFSGNEHFVGFKKVIEELLRKRSRITWRLLKLLGKFTVKMEQWTEKMEQKSNEKH